MFVAIYFISKIPERFFVLPVWLKVLFSPFQAVGLMIMILSFRSVNIFELSALSQRISFFRHGKVIGDVEGINVNRPITSRWRIH